MLNNANRAIIKGKSNKDYYEKSPNYTICNERDTGYLDGAETTQYASWVTENFVAPTEFYVQCDGYHPQGRLLIILCINLSLVICIWLLVQEDWKICLLCLKRQIIGQVLYAR